MTDHDDATVTYTVREILNDIKMQQAAGFARVETSMAGKADKADVARLETRLDQHAVTLERHDTRLGGLEGREHEEEIAEGVLEKHQQQRWTTKHKVWATLGTVGVVVSTLMSGWVGAHF